MDAFVKTPKKLSFKNVMDVYTICIICCDDITSKEASKGRRSVNHFLDTLKEADKDYCEVFETNSPNRLFVCKTCVAILQRIEKRKEKCKSLQEEWKLNCEEIKSKSVLFKTQYTQWKRGNKPCHLSPFTKKYKTIPPKSPSKLPLPTKPAKSLPSPLRSCRKKGLSNTVSSGKIQKKLFHDVSMFVF